VPIQEQIDYLVERRFPGTRATQNASLARGAQTLSQRKLLDEAESYRRELGVLQPDEIAKLFRQEHENESAALRAKAEREERERFYNQPYAVADFEYWAKAAHWTFDEAIALSFGKAPEHVTWTNVEPYQQISRLARQYARRRELALRAVPWKKLFDPVLPSIFMQWASRSTSTSRRSLRLLLLHAELAGAATISPHQRHTRGWYGFARRQMSMSALLRWEEITRSCFRPQPTNPPQ
jgi:hypothetical protein